MERLLKTYVIGDIHGEFKRLKKLIEKMPIEKEDKLIFLGDYIDRGSDSRKVVDFIIEFKKTYDVVTLMGNHEDLMLSALKPDHIPANNYNPSADIVWSTQGGYQTMLSYDNVYSWNDFPQEHKDFFNNLKLWYEDNNCYYVHAALCDKIPQETSPKTLLWHRFDSISEYELFKNLIYGHTPNKEGVLFQDTSDGLLTICVDTGSGKTGGKLSGVCIDTLEIWEEK